MNQVLHPHSNAVKTSSSQPSFEGPKPPLRLGFLAWLPIPLFMVAVTILFALDIRVRFEPPFLLPVLNILFLTVVSLFVAFLAARTYVAGGVRAALFLGCGMWILGIASGIAGVLGYLGMDAYVVTVHNCGALLAGLSILISALLATLHADDKSAAGPPWWLPALYLAALGTILLITMGALEDFIPPFFLPGIGATPLRQMVIIAACLQFAVSSVLFGTLCRRSTSRFLRWYAMGLALIAIGLLGVIPQNQLGTPINWAARLAQYLGGVYILYAAITAFRQHHVWGIPIGRAFQELEQRHRSLVELCPDAILVHSEGRYVYANPAAAHLFGAESPEDLVGKDVMELVAPVDRDLGIQRIQQAYAGTATPLRELKFIRFDGRPIDVQTTGSYVEFGGKPAVQIVVRDITDLKSAEAQLIQAKLEAERRAQELEESKRVLDALMAYIPEGITIANAPGVHTVMTSKYGDKVLASGIESTKGLSMEDWLASVKHYLADGTTPARAEDLPLTKAVRLGETVEGLEMVLHKPSGDLIRVLCNAGPIRDNDGNVTGGIVAWRDITDRKRTEELLRQSEERLRFALEASEMGHWDLNLVDHSAHRSLRHDQIFGYEEALPRWTYEVFLEHVVPEDRDLVDQKYRRAIEEQRDWDFECRIMRRDQQMRWIWARGRIHRDETGRPARLAGIVQDITARKQIEEALKSSERLYRAIGESIDYGVWVCAPDGRNIYASESFLNMVGMTQEQCANFGWGEVLHPDDAERTIAAWKDCVRTGGTWDIEHRFRGVDGKWHAVLARGVPVRNERGEITCWAGINLDISRLKQAEEALRFAMGELDYRVQERTQELSRTIDALQNEVTQRTLAEQILLERSQQLRLLSSELTLAEQRERQRLAQILHDGLQQILVGAKFRLALMQRSCNKSQKQATAEIEDLLDEAIETSRSLTAELSPPILHDFGLVPALEWLARWMRDKHGLMLDLRANPQVEPIAEDVKVLLFQATRELLFNVVKHAGVKTARMQLTQLDGRVQIVIADEGVGFDPMQLRAAGGSTGGFGLFSIRERIHLLGGHMVIDSAPGKGSRLTLAFPSAAAKDGAGVAQAGRDLTISVSISPPQTPPAEKTENKIRILLVDDHLIMRQGLARLLKEAPDMEIVGEASDGESAVNLVRQVLPDVVLMDVSMPGMNGIQATQIIHAELPHIRVVGLSMFDEDAQSIAMRDAGAVGYLTKSGPADAIISAVRACASPSGEAAADDTGKPQADSC
jgi:PAS domain S-box-containing protein